MELRRILAYRLDFWVQFVGTVVIQMTVAWFLWSAVFAAKGSGLIGGFQLDQMMFYYLLVPLIDRLNRGFDNFQLSREIYDGSLTRYLLYPVPLLGYRYISHVARGVFSLVQLILALGVFLLIFGWPSGVKLSVLGLSQCLALCWISGLCYFYLAAITEMVAFWADNVWSLMVMLRFIVQMLGGAFLPLSLFPGWANDILQLTPFPAIVYVPVQLFMGVGGTPEFVRAVLVVSVWTVILALITQHLLARGLKQYTGVGI
jgi:ABC-2 type transport system permease protein